MGEIGGTDEEAAADFIRKYVTKPVVAYIAGVTAPPGKRMGHAGAVIAGGKGTAADKYRALDKSGARTVKSPADLGKAMAEQLAKRRAKPLRKPSGAKRADHRAPQEAGHQDQQKGERKTGARQAGRKEESQESAPRQVSVAARR